MKIEFSKRELWLIRNACEYLMNDIQIKVESGNIDSEELIESCNLAIFHFFRIILKIKKAEDKAHE